MINKLFILLMEISFTVGVYGQPFNLIDDSVGVNQFAVLYDIQFKVADENLPDIQQIELDMLVDFLIKNKNVEIELGVHTNFRGNDEFNLKLSKKRAINIKKYIVEKGVGGNRINAKGFGENKPVIEYEDWEELMKTHRCGYYGKGNRRVTVVITKV